MLLDLITLERFSEELKAAWQGRRLHRVTADGAGISLEAQGAPAHPLQVSFGPPGRVGLGPSPVREERGDRSLRYLAGARVESVSCMAGDRVLQVRLRRDDAGGAPTYGVLHVVLIPPRYRLCLAGERHGRILGVWSGEGDRRAPRAGDLHPQAPAPLADLSSMERGDWEALLSRPGTVAEGLRASLAGMDRHVIGRLCADAGVEPERPLSDCAPAVAAGLSEAGRRLRGGPHPHVFRWKAGGGWVRVSLLQPPDREGVERFPSVSEALRAPAAEPESCPPGGGQRARLRRAVGILERRKAAVESDLDEAGRVELLERTAHSLMASGEAAARGPGRLEVADVHDPAATIVVELEPGRSAAGQAGRMLRRARRFRRRLEVLPPRLERLGEQLRETRSLLDRLQQDGARQLSEERMERLERELGLAGGGGAGAASSGGARAGAHPRRYRTSSGWSVWAGRNNRENDLLTHRLAARNDLWFHARGYSGSHVILRREGRKEEPSRTTLEEAAAVAAYWSKGRTASKVPVVYTLARHVSRPRGASPGTASVKREKSLIVRPGLLPVDEGG